MKKTLCSLFLISFIILIFSSCGSDSQSDPDNMEEVITTENVKVLKFSKRFAYKGEEVSILGEKFHQDKSKIEILLNDKKVEIISATQNDIKIKIPYSITTNELLNLSITMSNSFITYSTGFEKITVLDNTKNKWIELPHDFNSIKEIRNFSTIDKEEIYFSLQKETNDPNKTDLFRVKKSSNGGVSIIPLNQDYNFTEDNGAFHISANGNEYSFRLGHLYKKVKNEESSTLLRDFSQNGSWGLDFYVSNDEKNIVVATSEGRIYSSEDSGSSFNLTHKNDPLKYQFETFSAVSHNNIWLAGFTNPQPSGYGPGKILYLKDDNKWHNEFVRVDIKNGNYEYIKKIHFLDNITGFAIVRINNANNEKYTLIKSNTKGNTWTKVHEMSTKIEGFTFKDKNTGWFIAGKEIYKTIDGGNTWNLAHTNDTDCKGIYYKDDVLWVIANEKLLKYYF